LLIQKKLEVVKKKSKFLTVLVLVMSMSSFAQTHNHDHDEDGGHADHVENGTHVRTAPTEKQLDSLLISLRLVRNMRKSLEDLLSRCGRANETD
jgi:hypothetical protein